MEETALTKAQSPWHYSPKALKAHEAAKIMAVTKNGMFSRVPIICKGHMCPYAKLCLILEDDIAPEGEYCPMETAQIEFRAAQYSEDFDIDNMSFTDKTLLNEIIGLDIMLERCRALMSLEGSPVQEITVGISDNGEEIRQPAVSKAWETYEKMSRRRDSIYQLMMMTRRDKKKDSDNDTINSLSNILNTITIEDINNVRKGESE